MSDIVNGSGTYILPEAYRGDRLPQRQGKWKWPRQPTPSPRDWHLWQIAIQEVWARSETLRLAQHLGNWIHNTHIRHTYTISCYGSIVREQREKQFVYYCLDRSHTTRNGPIYTATTDNVQYPRQHVPLIARPYRNNSIVGENVAHVLPLPVPLRPQTLQANIASLPSSQQYLLFHTKFERDGIDLVQALRNGTAVGVVDASVQTLTKVSTISWIITDTSRTFVCEGRSGCPRFHCAQDSYSAEMFGLNVLLLALSTLYNYHNVRKGSIKIACNNDSSLSIGLESYKRHNTTESYFDLVWALQQRRKKISVTIIPTQVAGHQEKKKRRLSFLEQLNVEMDHKAKAFRRLIEKGRLTHAPSHYGDTNWCVQLGNLHLSHNLEMGLRDHIQGTALVNHLLQKR